ncbi:LysR family transcriptional regulator [Paenibacillus thermotolerans]|uniref:LysR family transcriptional regulator n=1 Tax=Paenibacillus thermotolerans TaxID=3027807 RepID=UPI00236789D0|nr:MULTISPECIES: LysR substrate-binding domain-containing protein [unclassified Paenibacillus]
MNVNIEWYRIFLHAAEAHNLTKAAQKLHMTQPSVSYAMKQLEGSLGVELFERLSKGVRLTEEGQVLCRHIRQAFTQLDAAERHINNMKRLNEGRIRIGANGAIVKHFLLSSLESYHARFADIRIQLSQDRTSRVLERLKQGSLDVGCIYLPVTDEEIEVVASYTTSYCAVAGAAFADRSPVPLSAERLAMLPLLMLTPGSSTRSFIEAWFRSQGVEAEADFELNSLEMIAEFAERGFGAAFLPRSFVASRIADGSLIELRTEVPLPDRQIGIAVRKHSSPSLATKAFLGMMPNLQSGS